MNFKKQKNYVILATVNDRYRPDGKGSYIFWFFQCSLMSYFSLQGYLDRELPVMVLTLTYIFFLQNSHIPGLLFSSNIGNFSQCVRRTDKITNNK